MRRKKIVDPSQLGFNFEQFSFDFGAHVETAERILQDAAEGETDYFKGEANHDHRTDSTADNRTNDFGAVDASGSGSRALQPPGLEDPRPLGVQLAAEAPAAGAARGDLAAGTPAGTAEDRSSGADLSRSASAEGRGRSGARDPGNKPGQHRTVTADDYVITANDHLGAGGAKTKFRDNAAALETLRILDAENRPATPQEQSILVRYAGWGGIPQAFDHRNSEWQKEFAELSTLLSADDYAAARRSTQDAHFTPQTVVEAIYRGVEQFGFAGGKVLDPALGSGHFIGLMPEALRSASKVTGIELDPSTAKIAKHLYPTSTVIAKGFEDVTIPAGYFDLVVGNPPFGNQSVYDQL